MSEALIAKVKQYLLNEMFPIVGCASAERLNELAPKGFRPEDHLPGAKSVIIYARPAPIANYMKRDEHGIYLPYIATFHNLYRKCNEISDNITYMLDQGGEHRTMGIPAYSPLKYNGDHMCGIISLKHAAVEAGLGKLGKNTLVIHPEFGNIVRFGGFMTTMEWPVDGPKDFPELCPADCHLCEQACPVHALKGGEIDHHKCMAYAIEDTMRPPWWVMKLMKAFCTPRFIERYACSFAQNYGIHCVECLTKCPHFPAYKEILENEKKAPK